MPNKQDTLQAIAAKYGFANWSKDGIDRSVSAMLSAAYDAGRQSAEDDAEVWYIVECTPIGADDWVPTGRGGYYDSIERAKTAMLRQPIGQSFDYRIVEKRLATRPVEVKP